MSEEESDFLWEIRQQIKGLFEPDTGDDEQLQELVERAYCYGQHMMADSLKSWAQKYEGLHEVDSPNEQ